MKNIVYLSRNVRLKKEVFKKDLQFLRNRVLLLMITYVAIKAGISIMDVAIRYVLGNN